MGRVYKVYQKKWWVVCLAVIALTGCALPGMQGTNKDGHEKKAAVMCHSAYTTMPYAVIHENEPNFTKKEKKRQKVFESYSPLDSLGRCGVAYATICQELMPTQKRQGIGMIKPSGWHTIKYAAVDGLYLYNRCHLIGYQLAGENANEKNLITGTRYMNVEGMLPFEEQVASYVKETGNHVLYRVTPVYEGENLVAEGVQMEAYSLEDKGKGIQFNVFVYNVQPGITIDYTTGNSALESQQEQRSKEKEKSTQETQTGDTTENTYILNTNTKRIHMPDCSSVEETLPKNRKKVKKDIAILRQEGYVSCKRCNPR